MSYIWHDLIHVLSSVNFILMPCLCKPFNHNSSICKCEAEWSKAQPRKARGRWFKTAGIIFSFWIFRFSRSSQLGEVNTNENRLSFYKYPYTFGKHSHITNTRICIKCRISNTNTVYISAGNRTSDHWLSSRTPSPRRRLKTRGVKLYEIDYGYISISTDCQTKTAFLSHM